MKNILLGLYLLLQVQSVFACDACGASASNTYIGILPQFNRHFIGFKYQFRHFNSNSLADPAGNTRNSEFYHTWSIFGKFNLHKRVQMQVGVPIHYYLQNELDETRDLAGPGDIWLTCSYQPVQLNDSSTKNFRQSVLIGGGIKLPTGRYNISKGSYLYDRNMQPGTGSWDVLASVQYVLRWKGWGLNMECNGRISTLNPDNYLYGHQLYAGAKGFYWGQKNSWSYLISAGVGYDYRSKDNYMHQFLPNTGGHLISGIISAEVYVKKWGIGVDAKIPCYAMMGGGLVKPGIQTSAHILFMF